jgi:hypothetical protein
VTLIRTLCKLSDARLLLHSPPDVRRARAMCTVGNVGERPSGLRRIESEREPLRNIGLSQEPVHDVEADEPAVRMSESFRDGGENR